MGKYINSPAVAITSSWIAFLFRLSDAMLSPFLSPSYLSFSPLPSFSILLPSWANKNDSQSEDMYGIRVLLQYYVIKLAWTSTSGLYRRIVAAVAVGDDAIVVVGNIAAAAVVVITILNTSTTLFLILQLLLLLLSLLTLLEDTFKNTFAAPIAKDVFYHIHFGISCSYQNYKQAH